MGEFSSLGAPLWLIGVIDIAVEVSVQYIINIASEVSVQYL